MHTQTPAFVVHRTPARIRIKVPERRGQQAYFAALERILVKHPDVLRVHLNPLTAGVIIECRKGFELTAQHCRFLGLEMLEPKGIVPATGWPGYGVQNDRNGALSDALTLASVIHKLIVAITTRQVGIQLVQWIIDGSIEAARHEAYRRARA